MNVSASFQRRFRDFGILRIVQLAELSSIQNVKRRAHLAGIDSGIDFIHVGDGKVVVAQGD